MTYIDTTLAAEAGYTYVNARQVYDAVAGAMTTHPAWDFVESVDAISAPNTYRRYVWKCNAAQSGLTADFFVVFQVPFTTATGATLGWHTTSAVSLWLGETYSAGTLGKFATGPASVTIAADRTNPATFPLATYASPATILGATIAFGITTASTSARFWFLVAKDAIILTRGMHYSGNTSAIHVVYVGAYESVMNTTDDPMPLVAAGHPTNGGNYYSGGATRVPTLTPSTAYTDAFSVVNSVQGSNFTYTFGGDAHRYTVPIATLGDAANLNWFKNYGGPWVAKLVVGPSTTANAYSTKGIFRGFYKYVYRANYLAHSYGDTFIVNGKVHVGTGDSTSGPVVDTEAA